MTAVRRLVTSLGLHSTLAEYKVPVADAPQIAALAMGGTDDPHYGKVVALLEGLYPGEKV